jgi:hypothetical protein
MTLEFRKSIYQLCLCIGNYSATLSGWCSKKMVSPFFFEHHHHPWAEFLLCNIYYTAQKITFDNLTFFDGLLQ